MILVSRPYLPHVDKYKAYIDEIYHNGWLTNDGPLVRQLQSRLEAYLGVKHLLLVANGTLALQLAYQLLELSGEVITSPFSFIATTSSLVWQKLHPVFVDIDANTYNIDPQFIEQKITGKTSAILPVHVFGNICDIETIEAIAKKNGLKVIYDAAHAFGVRYQHQSVLNFGDISTVSFHATKLFHTIEGGALIIKNDQLYQKAKSMINFGLQGADVKYLGSNFKMNEFQAAMGLAVLDDIDSIVQARKLIWDRYNDAFKNQFKLQSLNPHATRNYHYFPMVFKHEKELLKVQQRLNEHHIFPRRYFSPSLDTLSYVAGNSICEISRSIAERILCLPLFVTLSTREQNLIIRCIKQVTQ